LASFITSGIDECLGFCAHKNPGAQRQRSVLPDVAVLVKGVDILLSQVIKIEVDQISVESPVISRGMQLVALCPLVLHLRPFGIEQERRKKIGDLNVPERPGELTKRRKEYLEPGQ